MTKRRGDRSAQGFSSLHKEPLLIGVAISNLERALRLVDKGPNPKHKEECDPEERNSCDSFGEGKLMNNAFEYILKSGGIQREEDCPYTGADDTCHFDKSKVAWFLLMKTKLLSIW